MRESAHRAVRARPHRTPRWMETLTDRIAETPTSLFGTLRNPEGRGRSSAVLMLFGPGAHGGEDVVLTERATRMRSHAGQVSFPGGRVDPHDPGPVSAALREANEEIDLDPAGVEIVSTLPEVYLPVSNSRVTPVLGWWREPSPIRVRSAHEVARVARVPVPALVDPDSRFVVTHPNGYRGPGFEASGLFVWGFTAGLLTAVFDLAGLDRGWDRDRTRDLPARYSARRSPMLPDEEVRP